MQNNMLEMIAGNTLDHSSMLNVTDSTWYRFVLPDIWFASWKFESNKKRWLSLIIHRQYSTRSMHLILCRITTLITVKIQICYTKISTVNKTNWWSYWTTSCVYIHVRKEHRYFHFHYSDVIWSLIRLKSPTTRSFVNRLFITKKTPNYWPHASRIHHINHHINVNFTQPSIFIKNNFTKIQLVFVTSSSSSFYWHIQVKADPWVSHLGQSKDWLWKYLIIDYANDDLVY